MSKRAMSTNILCVLLSHIIVITLRCCKGMDHIPALVIFGDSTVDVGTNNYLATLVRSDFQPYGRDLGNKLATGRFSNGLLVNDYIAQELGLPYPLAYLDPEAQGGRLLQGINFASSASGWADSTAEIFNVQSLKQQVKNFKDYKNKLVQLVGSSHAEDILDEALYIISTGGNDYVNNYYLNPVQRDRYNPQQWQELLISSATEYILEVYNAGARKIAVASTPAIGCLPSAISLYGEGTPECVTSLNNLASDFNTAMSNLLIRLQSSTALRKVRFVFFDTFNPLLEAFQNPSRYGFVETRKSCCGTGLLEVAILCNADSPGTCSDASKYLFFDSFHPSQTFYKLVSHSIFLQIQSGLQS